jgi:hypothetical protein
VNHKEKEKRKSELQRETGKLIQSLKLLVRQELEKYFYYIIYLFSGS